MLFRSGQLLANTGRATATSAIYGGISGAGNSDAYDIGGILDDAQNAALTSGIISGASYPVALGIGGIGNSLIIRLKHTTGSLEQATTSLHICSV